MAQGPSRDTVSSSSRPVPLQLLDAMIRPSSIAVLGASAKKFASANQAVANLRAHSYPGRLYVIHREASSVEGLTTLASVDQLPADLDLALVSLPARGVVAALRQLEEIGCRSAVVPSAGLTAEDKSALQDIARRQKMAILGPNTLGLLNLTDGIPLVFWAGWFTEEQPGPIGLIAQSGGASTAVVKSVERARFSKIIASGNEWAVGTSDYLRWLAHDPTTEAVGLILESVTDVPGFVAAVEEMRAQRKPIVALHVGRSSAGAAATTAHTAALIGRPQAYRAFFSDLDLPVVDDYDEMASVLDAFAIRSLPRARGRSIAVVTESGGISALAADTAQTKGIQLSELQEATKAALVEILPGSHPLNPFDSGGSVAWSSETFAGAIRTLARDPNVDSVMVILDAQATLTPAELELEEDDFQGVAAAAADIRDKPLVVVSSTSLTATHQHWRDTLGETTPMFRGIANGLVVLHSLGMNRAAIPNRSSVGPALDRRMLGELQQRVAETEGPLPADLTGQLLDLYGFDRAASSIVGTPEEAARFADQHGFPVVLKTASPQIAHRSNVGGVVVGIRDHDSLRAAMGAISERVATVRPDAAAAGFEIQEHVQAPLEAMVGFVTDPVFGPVVTVGLGGVLVEILGDSAFALAPVEEEKAMELIAGTRLGTIARGYRNLIKPTDLRPLARVLMKLSLLASDFQGVLAEGDLNPVLIQEGSGRARLVDALLVGRSPGDRSSGTEGPASSATST